MTFLHHLTPYLPTVAFIGTYLLIIANDRAQLPGRVKKRGIKAEGTVVELYQNPGSLFSQTPGEGRAPVVEFTTPNGTLRHHGRQFTTPSLYQVGQKVDIWYYFYKSKREVTLADEGPGALPGVLFRWGLALCIVGYPLLIKNLLALVA